MSAVVAIALVWIILSCVSAPIIGRWLHRRGCENPRDCERCSSRRHG